MLLLKEKIIYIHIPKTGGSAIEQFLLKYFGYNDIVNPIFLLASGLIQNQKYLGLNLGHKNLQHFSLNEVLMNCYIFSPDVKDYEAFTVVRNPYSRAMSCMKYQHKLPLTLHGHTIYSPEEKRFLLNQSVNFYFTQDPMLNDWGEHRLPQVEYIDTTKIECKIFKYEDSLEHAIKNGITKHQIEIPKEGIPKLNDMQSKWNLPPINNEEFYSRTFIETVNNFYKEDFEYFDYKMLNPLDFED